MIGTHIVDRESSNTLAVSKLRSQIAAVTGCLMLGIILKGLVLKHCRFKFPNSSISLPARFRYWLWLCFSVGKGEKGDKNLP